MLVVVLILSIINLAGLVYLFLKIPVLLKHIDESIKSTEIHIYDEFRALHNLREYCETQFGAIVTQMTSGIIRKMADADMRTDDGLLNYQVYKRRIKNRSEGVE